MSTKPQKLRSNQQGLVSFMVVMFIMFVLALIVLAFARMVRREQVQTLDRQLNAQAFYAAESGVNDAVEALANDPSLAEDTYDGCNDFIDEAGLAADLGNGVSYSCLLVDATPPSLVFDEVPTDTSKVIPIVPAGGTPITSITIEWRNVDTGMTDLSGCPLNRAYPQTWPSTCQVGMLRVELLPFNGDLTRSQLITNRAIAFLSPTRPPSGGSPNFHYNNAAGVNGVAQGGAHEARCLSDGRCRVTIDGVPGITRGYLRLRSIYLPNHVTITANNGSVDLVGGQAEIDVTGSAGGVLRRIKVRKGISSGGTNLAFPENALQSAKTICKLFTVSDGSASPSTGAPADECDIY